MTIKFVNHSYGLDYIPLGKALAEDFMLIANRYEGISHSVSFHTPADIGIPAPWLKIIHLKEALATPSPTSSDWIVWVDSDVMLVNNEIDPRDLLDETKDIIISTDNWGLCTGFIAVRNSSWSRDFLSTVWFLRSIDPVLYPEYDGRDTWEQNTFKALLRCFPSVRDRCSYFTQSVVQNRCSLYDSSAWMFHFWMDGRTTSEILAKRDLVKNRGWSKEVFDAVGKFERLRWRSAVSLGRRLELSNEELAALLRMSQETFPMTEDDWLSGVAFERLWLLTTTFENAVSHFRDEKKAVRWLKTQNQFAGRKTPLELMYAENGSSELARLLKLSISTEENT